MKKVELRKLIKSSKRVLLFSDFLDEHIEVKKTSLTKYLDTSDEDFDEDLILESGNDLYIG